MYVVFILLKALVMAKVSDDYLETSKVSRRDSVFSSVTTNSIVLHFVSPPKTGFWTAQGEMWWDVVGRPGSVKTVLSVLPWFLPFLPGSRAQWGSAQVQR